jgi:hypothetical protein
VNNVKFFFLFVALFVMSGLAFGASDLPKRKSGLWEIKISNPTHKGTQAIQQCIDEKTDDLTKNNMPAMEKQSCSKNEMRREGDKWVAESICKFDGRTMKTGAVFTGKFDSAYKADIKSTYEPPLHGMRESSAVIDVVGVLQAWPKARRHIDPWHAEYQDERNEKRPIEAALMTLF